ncbi:GspH/FimT family pseudopilin [Verrucomicrobiota bacterium]
MRTLYSCFQSAFRVPHSAFRSSGFSILELVVVMIIIGILASVALLSMPDLQGSRDELAVDELSEHLRYIRDIAVNREQTTRVEFDTATDSYSVYIGGGTPVKDPVTQEDWVVNVSERFSGVTLSSVNINGGSVLCFSEPNGIPCDGSTNPITTQGTITFSSGLAVNITPDTGYISY